jgi:hypothetical protein
MSNAADDKFDVVLVFHTSRFARSQVEARRYKQLLRERLNIRVVSVTQPMGEDHTDPSAFLAESIHEMFDEYYSVSLSFWTRSGLREKARQGHLVGTLPWGYVRDPASKLAVPHPERAPLVLGMFKRYATGQETDNTIAAWLNAKGARSAKGRPFGKDTVREMLCNAAYAGYVTGLRSKDRSVRGLHEPIVPDELFDRVQEVRAWRTRVVKPGRPSDEYLLRKLLHCERCGASMHGTRGSRAGVRRYQCSTRRHHGTCEQAIVQAQPIEQQLIHWLANFKPDEHLRQLILDAINAEARGGHGTDETVKRRQLLSQLERLRDLYVLGDFTKAQYVMRRQAIEEELQRTKPPVNPNLDRAQKLLEDFARFWDAEPERQPSGASSSQASSSASGKRTAGNTFVDPETPGPAVPWRAAARHDRLPHRSEAARLHRPHPSRAAKRPLPRPHRPDPRGPARGRRRPRGSARGVRGDLSPAGQARPEGMSFGAATYGIPAHLQGCWSRVLKAQSLRCRKGRFPMTPTSRPVEPAEKPDAPASDPGTSKGRA